MSSATLPRIRVESRGGRIHIRADTIPKNFRRSATLLRYKKEPARVVIPVVEKPKTPKVLPTQSKHVKKEQGKQSMLIDTIRS